MLILIPYRSFNKLPGIIIITENAVNEIVKNYKYLNDNCNNTCYQHRK